MDNLTQLRICKIPDDGKLFGLEFTKSIHNYYWVVRGPVPLEVASYLWHNEYNLRYSIRVNGNCTCPMPYGHQVVWRMPDDKKVLSMEAHKELLNYSESKSELMKSLAIESLNKYLFSDDPTSIGAKGYIELYHIDDLVGLRVFTDYIRNYYK